MKKYWGLIIVLLLSFWAIKPLFTPGFFPIHDDTQVARVFEMGKALKSGMFPVRWVADLGYGYGYPIFNFYAPLAYYFGGFLTLAGFDALLATKIMIGIGVVLAGIFMYFLARNLWGEIGGVVTAIFYMYAPYHAVNIYVRGAIGELWGYAFLPLVFYGLWKFPLIGSIGFAGVILSHNLTALMAMPFLVIFALFHSKRYTLYAIFLGLLLSAFYWLPALFEMKYTNVTSQIGGGANFRDHFVCIQQLWDSPWGFGGSIKGCLDGLSFKIGKLHIITSIFSFLMALFFIRRIVWFLFGGFLISIFLMTEISKDLWEAIPLMAFLQYPWRFLLLASFFSSVLAGSLAWLIREQKLRYTYVGTILLLLLFFNIKLFQPQTILHKTYLDYTNEYALKWTASKISDEYLPVNVKLPISYVDIPKKNVNEKSVVVTVENHKSLFERYKDQLPPLRFEQTNLEKFANILSIIGVGILIIGIIYARKK